MNIFSFLWKVFPANRLRCHSCSESGTSTGCFTGVESNAMPCKLYKPDDKCYIRKTGMKSWDCKDVKWWFQPHFPMFFLQPNQLSEAVCRIHPSVWIQATAWFAKEMAVTIKLETTQSFQRPHHQLLHGHRPWPPPSSWL